MHLLSDRRAFLRDAFCGFGTLALASLLHEDRLRAAAANPLAPKTPHLPHAKAKSVIFLFMAGGPSHLETFDPKPLLNKLDGQPRPKEFGDAKYQFIAPDARLLGTLRFAALLEETDDSLRSGQVPGAQQYDDAIVAALEYMHFAERREVVDARIGTGIRRKNYALVEQHADAISHGGNDTELEPAAGRLQCYATRIPLKVARQRTYRTSRSDHPQRRA